MTAISARMPKVIIEYDCHGKRKQKFFENAYEARRFWMQKDIDGKHPKALNESKRKPNSKCSLCAGVGKIHTNGGQHDPDPQMGKQDSIPCPRCMKEAS